MNYTERITNKRVGIWGFGVVGQSAARFFSQLKPASITILDLKAPHYNVLLEQYRASWTQQTDAASVVSFLEAHDLILVSPGIDTRPYIAYAEKYISELDLFYQLWHKKSIAITGSVGKTTTTHLLGQLMSHAGIAVATGGNIGTPMLDLLPLQDTIDYAILELSSFQLEQSEQCTPDVAVITNLHANHLDRHGDMATYAQAKGKIFAHQGAGSRLILPGEIAMSRYYKDELRRYPGTISLVVPNMQSLEELYAQTNASSVYSIDRHKPSIIRHVRHDTSYSNVIALDHLPAITMLDNWLMLIAVLDIHGIDVGMLLAHHKNELSLPEDRMEYVGTFRGCIFLNDSKATIPHATLQACKTVTDRNIILILGGLSKGVDRSELIEQLPPNIAHIICFGKEASQLAAWCLQRQKQAYATENLEACMTLCAKLVQPGMTVLFSPSGSSYDLFTNYHERGTRFKTMVHTIFAEESS